MATAAEIIAAIDTAIKNFVDNGAARRIQVGSDSIEYTTMTDLRDLRREYVSIAAKEQADTKGVPSLVRRFGYKFQGPSS